MIASLIPGLPPSRGPGEDGGTAEIAPRYEDITQDGRMQLHALMPGLGAAVWKALLSKIPAVATFRTQGILPVLRRLVIACEDRPVTVNRPLRYEGSFRFAKEKDGDRIFANMWLQASAPIGTTLGPNPPKDAPYELVGRVFAEHVITRPFAPPAERRVTRLDAPGVPPVPEDEHVFETAEALIESAGAPLEDEGHVAFAMMHTDSNQHVNSMTYPRVFEEIAVRRIMHDARVPVAHELLARAVELRWRRPFFAGEKAKIQLALVESEPGAKIAAVGAFSPVGDHGARRGDGPKPSSAIKMLFR
jgi:hypothetical protein